MQYPPAVLEAGNGEPFGTLALLGKPDTKTVLSIPTSLEPTTVTLPDGRTALYIYLRRERTDGLSTWMYITPYQPLMYGMVTPHVMSGIVAHLNWASARHNVRPKRMAAFALLTAGLGLVVLEPYAAYKRRQHNRAMEAAVRDINELYGGQGIRLTRVDCDDVAWTLQLALVGGCGELAAVVAAEEVEPVEGDDEEVGAGEQQGAGRLS